MFSVEILLRDLAVVMFVQSGGVFRGLCGCSLCLRKFLGVFNVRQKTDARYSYRLDVRLSVCPSHAGIVSRRLNLSSNCLHCLVAL